MGFSLCSSTSRYLYRLGYNGIYTDLGSVNDLSCVEEDLNFDIGTASVPTFLDWIWVQLVRVDGASK